MAIERGAGATTAYAAQRYAPRTTTPPAPATAPQLRYIQSLWAERSHTLTDDVLTNLTKIGASLLITHLQDQPRVPSAAPTTPAAATTPELVPGMYFDPTTDTLVKVQVSQSSGKPYGKALVITTDPETGKPSGHFAYAPGIMRTLTPAMLATTALLAAKGRLYGVCCDCGRTLSDPVSVEAGQGPICGGRRRR